MNNIVEQYTIESSETFGLDYDINSIMHYNPCLRVNELHPKCYMCTLWPVHAKD